MSAQPRFYVYMMMSSSRRALYTGITSRPRQRVWEHKTGATHGFSQRYRTTRLVYFESYRYVAAAIAREKQIKRWRREKKLALIEPKNPQYRDLAADWFEGHCFPTARSLHSGLTPLGRDDKLFGDDKLFRNHPHLSALIRGGEVHPISSSHCTSFFLTTERNWSATAPSTTRWS